MCPRNKLRISVSLNVDIAYGTKNKREYIKSFEDDIACPNKSNAKIIYKFNKGQYKGWKVVERYL